MLIHFWDRIYYTFPAKQSYGACFISLLLTLNLFFVGAQLATLLSTSRAPSVQWFLLAFPFLISLSISNGFLMSELNLQYQGVCAPSVSPEVFQGGLWLTIHHFTHAIEKSWSPGLEMHLLVFFYFNFLDADGAAFMCVSWPSYQFVAIAHFPSLNLKLLNTWLHVCRGSLCPLVSVQL